MAAGWFYSPKQIGRYLLTRPTSLKPPKVRSVKARRINLLLINSQGGYAGNPIRILRQLDRHQWLMFIVGWLGWMWDAFDFFTVSLTITEIAKEFKVSNSDVSWVSPLFCSSAVRSL